MFWTPVFFLVALFWKAMEHLGGKAKLENRNHVGQVGIAPQAVLSLPFLPRYGP